MDNLWIGNNKFNEHKLNAGSWRYSIHVKLEVTNNSGMPYLAETYLHNSPIKILVLHVTS